MWIRALLLFFLMTSASAQTRYFLCGPDEDGCNPDEYPYCFCMPYDEGLADSPYCLDFETVACVPLSRQPQCAKANIFTNQATCLAVAFQSEAEPPCPLVSEQFCKAHHVSLCRPDAGMAECSPDKLGITRT